MQRDDSIRNVIESQFVSNKKNSKRYRETELPGGVIMSTNTKHRIEEATSNEFEQEEF